MGPSTLNEEVARVAVEIERYLEAHPAAADTLEGIQQWWIPRQRLEEARETLRLALALLCSRGAVTEVVVGGVHVYRAPKGAGE